MKKWLALILAMLMLLSCIGCGGQTSESGSAENSGSPSSSDTASQDSDKVYKIAFSIPVAAAPYWTAVGWGVHKEVEAINEEAGQTVIEYQFFNPGNFELETQLKNIEDAISLGVDGMILAPVDSNGTVPAIENAAAEGIPICTVDLQAETDVILAGFCTYNYEAGVTAAETMAELINEKNGAYEGTVALNMGKANISSHVARVQGFKDTMAEKYPDIEIVFEQFADVSEDNLTVIEDALAQYADLDAVFTTGDTAADMACQAIDGAGRFKEIGDPDHIIVVGFDGEINGLLNIRNGRQDATVAQNPVIMGEMAARTIYEYLTEGTVPDVDEDGQIEVPHFAITYKNIDTDEAAEYFWAEEVDEIDISF